jgi:rubrerythrin
VVVEKNVGIKERKMEFENLVAIVDFAIEKEIEAAEFYTDLSKEETFSGSARMFEEFSQEERKHQKMLEDFKTQGVAASIEDYQFKWITDIKRSDYVVDFEYQKGMAYNEILMIAIKREEKALNLYNQTSSLFINPQSEIPYPKSKISQIEISCLSTAAWLRQIGNCSPLN